MKVMVIGSGGREHALAWKIAQNKEVSRVYVAPGNAGTALDPDMINVPISSVPDLLAFAQKEHIQLTIVGPEAPLSQGVVAVSYTHLDVYKRQCLYTGDAEYDTIAVVKQAIKIPLIANGDITTPEKAKFVLDYTGADAVMIGRAAQGRPWIFREIEHFIKTGEHLPPPEVTEIRTVMLAHLHDLYEFYGELTGMRMARKHISWYTKGLKDSANFRHSIDVYKRQILCLVFPKWRTPWWNGCWTRNMRTYFIKLPI